jgi:hypothetical protein
MATKLVSKQELLTLSKPQLVELAQSLGIETKGLLKEQLQKEIQAFQGLTMEPTSISAGIDSGVEKQSVVKSTSKQAAVVGVGRGKAVEKLIFSPPVGLQHTTPSVGQTSNVGDNLEIKLKLEQMKMDHEFKMRQLEREERKAERELGKQEREAAAVQAAVERNAEKREAAVRDGSR